MSVPILELVDPSCPGFVAFELEDVHGEMHRFVEKIPVVSSEEWVPGALVPSNATISGVVVGERVDDAGNRVVVVDTEHPCGIEADGGGHRFDVYAATTHLRGAGE